MKGKKLLCGILGAVTAFSCVALAACGGKGGDNLVDDLQFDEFGDPIFNDVELKVWSIVGEPDNVYLDQVNDMFNDYYSENGLTADITSLSNSDFYTQLANTINTDPENAPDVIVIHSERLTTLARDNIIVPMDDYYSALGDNNTFSTDNYLSNLMAECMYDGKVYGVPLDVHAGVWFVREDILEKNDLQKPSTLTEFVDVCNALIEKYNNGTLWTRSMDRTNPANCSWVQGKDFGEDYNPVVMSSSGGIEQGWIPQTAVFQNGGSLTDDRGYPAWNTDVLTEVMQMFRDWQTGENTLLLEDGSQRFTYEGAFVSDNNDYNTVWSKLSSGEAVFSCEGPWWIEQRFNEHESVLGELEDAEGNTYEPLGIMNMSKLYALDENAETASAIYGVGHCFSICRTVTSRTRRVAAAIYAQYMTENAIDYMQGGHLPANKAILESEQFTSKDWYQRYLVEFGDPENFIMLGNTPYYSAVYETLKDLYSDVFTPSMNSIPVADLVESCYQEALNEIAALEGL